MKKTFNVWKTWKHESKHVKKRF